MLHKVRPGWSDIRETVVRHILAVAGLILLSMFVPWAPGFAQVPPVTAPEAVTEPPTPLPAPTPTSGRPLTAEDAEAWLDGFVPTALARGGIAGAVVVIVKDGEVLIQKGYGYSDLEQRTPVDPDRTLFRPGSIAKLFTWTAVMQQVEAGAIDLDADVNRYLDFEIPPYDGKPITMRHILTHTAGFEDFYRGLITSDPTNGNNEESLKRWTPLRVFEPGTTPAYSNYATGLAGYIVERVSGIPFDDYIDQRIHQPLQMSNSTFRQPLPANLAPMMSSSYAQLTEPEIPFEIVNVPPAGSLSSTGADMANFMIAHLQRGQFGDARILNEETARMMHETRTDIMAPLHGMRLGFYQQDINGRRVITHGGDTTAFHSLLSLFLDENVGLYQSVNTTGGQNANFRQLLFEAFADRYFPASIDDPVYDPTLAAAEAQNAADSYIMTRGAFSNFGAAAGLLMSMKLVVNEDGTVSVPLLLVDSAGQPKRYQAIGPYLWREVGGHDRLGAKVVDGKVQFLSSDALSAIIVLKPAPALRDAAWLMPSALAGVGTILLTVLFWPVAAVTRRRYGHTLQIAGQRRKAYRAVRVGGILVLAAIGAWAWVFTTMTGTQGMDSLLTMDVILLATQAFTAFAVVGGLGLSIWNLVAVWKGPSGWFGKLWSILLVLAFGIIFWFALAGNLMKMTANY